MKKILTLSVCLFLLFALFTLYPLAAEPVSGEKDGIAATLTILPATGEDEAFRAELTVNNQCAYAQDFRISFSLPGGIIRRTGELAPDLETGKETKLAYTFGNPLPEENPSSEDSGKNGGKGCRSSFTLPFLVLLVLVVLAALILTAKKARKGVAFFLAFILTVSALVCLGTVPLEAATTERALTLKTKVPVNGEEKTFRVYLTCDHVFSEVKRESPDNFGQFDITYFDSPYGDDALDEDFYIAMADCGFTTCPLQKISTENAKIALGLLKKYNLTCNALQDDRIYSVLARNSRDITQEEVDAIVLEVTADYAEFDNLKGFHLWDEPGAGHFRLLGMFVDAFHRLAPQYKTYINLFPTYAGRGVGTDTYQEYLQRFVDEVHPDCLSYDHYHFTGERTAREGFFSNIEYVRDAALAGDLDAMVIVLLTCHNSYADITKSQLDWEVYMSLVYGFKRVSYYQFYMLPEQLERGWYDCCIDSNKKIYPHYYDVQEVSSWLMPLGQELYGKNSTAVFHVSGGNTALEPGCTEYTPYGDVGEIAGRDLVIGFFDDNSFMVVNKKFEARGSSRNIVFKDIKSGLEYFDPATSAWKDAESDGVAVRNENGYLSVTMKAGNGFLFRVAEQ